MGLALALLIAVAYAWRLRKRQVSVVPSSVQFAALRAQLGSYDEAAKLLAARITYERAVRTAVGIKA